MHDVALQKLPVVFALDRSGLVGADGPTHHGVLDLTYLRAIPGLVVAAPRDENELQHLLATAVASGRPFAVRFPRGSARGVTLDPEARPLTIGRGELLREGDDVALVALGKTVDAALEAAEELGRRGVDAAVVDARFAKPLDVELLTELGQRCGHVVTLEDHVLHGGFGSAVLEALAETAPQVAVRRFGLPDAFVEHGSAEEQWRWVGLDAASVVAAVERQVAPAPPRRRAELRAVAADA